MQNGVNDPCIERYIAAFSTWSVTTGLTLPLTLQSGTQRIEVPILFFAIEKNSPTLVRMLCNAGASPDAVVQPWGIPLLAYAAISAEYEILDTTNVLIALLAAGADPYQIPRDMWEEPLKAPKVDLPNPWESNARDEWCTLELRQALARTLNLMQRYSLHKAPTLKLLTPRILQVARANNIVPLFEAPYHLVGQQNATETVLELISNYYAYKQEKPKPLVLLLTGLSGHGKTELAKQMGRLLGLKMHVVDCTAMTRSDDLLGPPPPMQGHSKGSPLNNHLADHAGQRSVVFLDEFDKTTDEVRQSLLLLFESGEYNDHRHGKSLDCSKVIWVLAANVGIEKISRYWDDYLKTMEHGKRKDRLYRQLQRAVASDVKAMWGAWISGRIHAIVPYVPFDEVEQAVATFKFMRGIQLEARKPIDMQSDSLMRHLSIKYVDDGQIAQHLAKDNYERDLGARSLDTAVTRGIAWKIGNEWGAMGKTKVSDEMNQRPLEKYDVRVAIDEDGQSEVEVEEAGVQAPVRREDE